ncbi:HIRAN domain-containing protein [Trinickia diaoshuihuensis]|uniref:HIRAN domain-containing protein n=1 Tax=Trinickia diaoshuihuensis TaxID=2292265 RepID=UPI000E25DF91|nr:HIRAN domain-containing protein [Trinickia diaoshuihuensis]
MEALYLAWQQPESREWIPVARLDRQDDVFRFVYTKGAKRASGFRPFGRMVALDKAYYSTELFPLFNNRVLTRSRPEFADYFRWTGLPEESISDPLPILAVTGGLRGTDPIELFAAPARTADNKFKVDFFARGLRHVAEPNLNAADELVAGARLFLMHDIQNGFDPFALSLRTSDPSYLVGYCPKYYTKTLCTLLRRDPSRVYVTVKRVNRRAPLSMRLLCSLQADWPEDFVPFVDSDDFAPLASI